MREFLIGTIFILTLSFTTLGLIYFITTYVNPKSQNNNYEVLLDVKQISEQIPSYGLDEGSYQDYNRVDKEFIPYIKKFFRDLDNFEISYTIPEKFIFEFKDLDSYESTSHVHGVSFGTNNDEFVEIYINKKSWDSFGKTQKYYIVYHELSHDILNLDDLSDSQSNHGKIMFPYLSRYDSLRMDDFISNMQLLFDSL